MKKRIFLIFISLFLLFPQVSAEKDVLKWVDFELNYTALKTALDIDIASQEEEKAISWIDILALASVRKGPKRVSAKAVKDAAAELRQDQSPQELLGEQYSAFAYYHRAYEAVLGGLVGNYAIKAQNAQTGKAEWKAAYGLKAFSPIAAGYDYCHYDDFGNQRSYGFARRHLGNDLMGALGTPIIAVESGTVEALGWNQYGGWRIGIRSDDSLRYYYYAHLRKDAPYAKDLRVGQHVTAGDIIGFMGRTGYSTKENTNNIETVHLHFGLQLVFDESQKECNAEIWVDVYDLVRLLDAHRSSVSYDAEHDIWERVYPYRDLDSEP